MDMRLPVIFLVVLLLVASLACRADTEAGGEPEASAEPEAEFVEVEMVVGPGSFDLPETRTGLAELSSYKAVLTVAFNGTRAGTPERRTTTYEMLYTAEPSARQLTIQSEGNAPDGAPESRALMAEMGGAGYELDEDGGCVATVFDPEDSIAPRWEPAGLLIGVFGAEEAGHETLNGLEVDHYTFDERALVQPGLSEATGEMWVASQGGFITRYTLTTRGDANYFGEGTEGTITWEYELTDVNVPVTIELPEDCPAGMVDAPLLPDASNVVNVPSVLAYDTASSVADAAAFYRERMPGLGWASDRTPVIDATMAVLEFTKGDETLTIMVTPTATSRKIRILRSIPAQ